jgi:hypothetical protein
LSIKTIQKVNIYPKPRSGGEGGSRSTGSGFDRVTSIARLGDHRAARFNDSEGNLLRSFSCPQEKSTAPMDDRLGYSAAAQRQIDPPP